MNMAQPYLRGIRKCIFVAVCGMKIKRRTVMKEIV